MLFLKYFVLLFEILLKRPLLYLFIREHGKDERYKAIEKSRDRESMFNEYIIDMKKKVSVNTSSGLFEFILHLSEAECLCKITYYVSVPYI